MTENYYIIAWILGITSLIFGVLEMILIHLFVRPFFRIGIPIIKRRIDVQTCDLDITGDLTLKKSEGKFYFSSNNKVYFLSKLFLFEFFRINTPFPLKAIGTINDNTIDIVVRVPLGTSLFFLFFSVGLFVSSGGFGLIGLVFVGIMIGISYPIEAKRMGIMIEELKTIYSAQLSRQP